MNENPEGTPNPLNPSPAAPVEPMAQPAPTAEPAPMTEPMLTEAPAAEPVAAPMQSTQPVAQPTPTEIPAPETEPKGSVVEPLHKKSKAGLIVAIVAIAVALIGGVVAALIVVNPFKSADRVPAAISKLLTNGAPRYVTVSGNAAIETDNEWLAFQNLSVDFNAGLIGDGAENYVNATIAATLQDESEFSFSAKEVHTDGNLYLMLEGVADALDNYAATTPSLDASITTNCDSEDVNCMEATAAPTTSVLDSLGLFEVIDGEWIQIPDSSFSNVTGLVSLDETAQCLIDAAGSLGDYGKGLATLYDDNQFITYSTENLAIQKKKDTLYKLGYDSEKLANFINGMNTSGFANELRSCTGQTALGSGTVTAGDLAQVVENLPTIYVEIDGDDNFTRLFLTSQTDSGTVRVDLSFGYPASVTVSAPEEYLTYSALLTKVMPQFYGAPLNDVDFDFDLTF